jgi:integrase/recombinase XerD
MPKIKKKKKETEDLIQDFIDYCSYKNLAVKTIKSYNQSLILFAKYLQEEKNQLEITKVKKEDVEDYMEFTKERGKYSFLSNEDSLNKNYMDKRKDVGKEISISTLNNYLRNIKVFFNWMKESNLIKFNTVSSCKFIKVQRVGKEQLSDLEFKKLIKSMDLTKYHEYRDYIIINLIFDSGMRLSETLSLTLEDIDFNRKTIYLQANVTKGKKDRVVFYSDTMSKFLKRWLRYKDSICDTALLFPTRGSVTNLSASNFERNFKVYLKRSGINKKITPHVLRNNFARRFLIASQGDIYTLCKILGHSSVTVTEKAYLDLNDEDLRKSYKKYSPLEALDKY